MELLTHLQKNTCYSQLLSVNTISYERSKIYSNKNFFKFIHRFFLIQTLKYEKNRNIDAYTFRYCTINFMLILQKVFVHQNGRTDIWMDTINH